MTKLAKRNNILETISLVMLFISLYTIGTVSSATATWAYTLAFFIGSVCLALLFLRSRVSITIENTVWLLVVMVCLLGCMHSGIFQDFGFYAVSFGFIIAFSNVHSEVLQKIFKIMIIGSIIFAIGVYFEFFFPSVYADVYFPLFPRQYQADIYRQSVRHRMANGFNTETSISAQFMMMGICSLYCIYPNMNRRRKIWSWILGIILFIGVVLTGKRSSLVFMVAAFLYTMLRFIPEGQRASRLIKILFAVLVIVMAAMVLAPRIVEVSSSRNTIVRIMEYMNDSDADVSNNRFTIWGKALAAFRSSPFIGHGWGWYKQGHGSGAHNIYLQLLCEVGVLGTFVVLAVLLYNYYVCHRVAKLTKQYGNEQSIALAKFAMFSQTYFLLYGITGNPLYNYSFFLWYVLSLSISINFYMKFNQNKRINVKLSHARKHKYAY